EVFDRSIGSFTWNSSEFIYFSYESAGQATVGQASVGLGGIIDPNLMVGSKPIKAELEWPDLHDGHIDNIIATPHGLYYTKNQITDPDEIYFEKSHPDPNGEKQITDLNESLLAAIDMQPIDDFTFKGAND